MKHLKINFLLLGLFVISCPRHYTPAMTASNEIKESMPPIAPLTQLVNADNNFGFTLFQKLTNSNPQQNIFISPTSINMCLRMLYNGAHGKTKQAMANTLGLINLTDEQTNQANLSLTNNLQTQSEKIILNIANSIWANKNIKFKENFLAVCQKYYQAEVKNLDFTDPVAAKNINAWVSEKTNNKINQIVDKLSPELIMILINAIYFNGQWATEFDKKLTQDRPFYLLNQTQIKVPMMNQTGEYFYYEDEQLQAIRLPYEKEFDNKMSMYIFLPKRPNTLANFIASLNAKTYQAYLEKFQYREGEIMLPRFKFEYEKSLTQVLSELGMANAFYNADFSNLTDTKAVVSDVIHKTFIEVNEQGTEAAAVTSVFVATSTAFKPEPFTMVVDHPFFCAIYDHETNAIVFMGAVVAP